MHSIYNHPMKSRRKYLCLMWRRTIFNRLVIVISFHHILKIVIMFKIKSTTLLRCILNIHRWHCLMPGTNDELIHELKQHTIVSGRRTHTYFLTEEVSSIKCAFRAANRYKWTIEVVANTKIKLGRHSFSGARIYNSTCIIVMNRYLNQTNCSFN